MGCVMTEEENKRQAALQTWLKETASAKIKAAVEDASLLFIERDAGDMNSSARSTTRLLITIRSLMWGQVYDFCRRRLSMPLRCSVSRRKG